MYTYLVLREMKTVLRIWILYVGNSKVAVFLDNKEDVLVVGSPL
jgi:hypothetical protein